MQPVVGTKVPTLCVYKGRDDHPAYAISNTCSAAHSRRYKCLHLACAGMVIVGTASLLLPCPEPVVPTTGKAPYSPFARSCNGGRRGIGLRTVISAGCRTARNHLGGVGATEAHRGAVSLIPIAHTTRPPPPPNHFPPYGKPLEQQDLRVHDGQVSGRAHSIDTWCRSCCAGERGGCLPAAGRRGWKFECTPLVPRRPLGRCGWGCGRTWRFHCR